MGPLLGSDPAIVEELSAANAGSGCWAEGWRDWGAQRRGLLLVGKDGLRLLIAPSQARAAVGGPLTGGPVQIRLPKELAFASPGYYTALGDTDLPCRAQSSPRLYFHVVPSAGSNLMAAVTSSLNEAGRRFPPQGRRRTQAVFPL